MCDKPKPTQSRIIREGTEGTCPKCNSTELRRFGFFGKKIGCINPECDNYVDNPNRNKFTNITEGRTKSNTKTVTSKRQAPPPPAPHPPSIAPAPQTAINENVYKSPGIYTSEKKYSANTSTIKCYSYNDMLLFAETCMLELLSTEPIEGGLSSYPEITSENLSRIFKVLRPYKNISKL